MSKENLDDRVLWFIKLLQTAGENISIRRVALGLWMSKSIRSINLSINRLLESWKIIRNRFWDIEINIEWIRTRKIPLVWSIACWWPILAEEVIEDYIPVSTSIVKDNYDYFLLRTNWDSMNELWIESWDIVLIKQQNICKNGDIVVALIDDEATLKEFRMDKWIVKLIPHSSNEEHKTIVVTENLIIQWVFEKNLGQF